MNPARRGLTKEGEIMLVLSRKIGQKIYLGENIIVTVVEIDRGKVRLGFEAPLDMPILREELVGPPKEREVRDEWAK